MNRAEPANVFDLRTREDPFRVEEAYDGIERRVLAHTSELMIVEYIVEENAIFPEHEHDEIHQAVYVLEGSIRLFGDHSATLREGDSFVVGPGVRHGIQGTAETSRVVDTFAPAVPEYR